MYPDKTAKVNAHAYSLQLPVALTIFSASLLFAYFETITHMMPAWSNLRGPYSHSFLLTALVFSLLWRDRYSLMSSPPSFSPGLTIGLLATSLLWFLFWAANIISGQILAVYFLFTLGFWSIFGEGSYRKLLPTLGLLLFALPLWQPIQPALQNIATTAVQLLISAMDIPVYVEGNRITIPNGIFEIEGGCSGIGFLLVSLSLSGYLSIYDRVGMGRAIRTLALSALVALLANWIRIYLIILVGFYEGMDHPLIADHVGFGWIVYSVLFFPFLYYVTKTTLQPSKAQALPLLPSPRISISYILLIVFLTTFASIAAFALTLLSQTKSPAPYVLPNSLLSFQKSAVTHSFWQPVFKSPDHVEQSIYRGASGSEIQAFTVSYLNQHQNSEVINLHNSFTGENFKVIKKTTRTVPNDPPSNVTELILQDPLGNVSVIWYWYYIGKTRTHTESGAKIHEVLQKMLGNTNAVVIALLVSCNNAACVDARTRLGRVAADQNFSNAMEGKKHL